MSRKSKEIAELALGTKVQVMGQANVQVDGRIRARIKARTANGSIEGWISMQSIDPPSHFVQPIMVVHQPQLDVGGCASKLGMISEEREVQAFNDQSLSTQSLGYASFADNVGLIVNVHVEYSAELRGNSSRELIALVRADKCAPPYEIAEAILRCVQLRLPPLKEPLHYQALFTDLGDVDAEAEDLAAYETLCLMIFINDPRDAALDFV